MRVRTTLTAFLKNYRVSVPVIVGAIALLSWLAFGYFGVHLLLVDDRVDEAAPIFATATTAAGAAGNAVGNKAPAEPTSVRTEAAGSFESGAHPTRGSAAVLGDGGAQRYLRFEGFETDNGPDLNVYLVNSAAGSVKDFIDLGDLKGNIGSQNYEVPAGTNLQTYDTVVIWCVRFSVAFGQATLVVA